MEKAQKTFQQVFDGLKDEQKDQFLRWIFETSRQSAFECLANKLQVAERKLAEITDDLRKTLPYDGIVKSEKIYFPKSGEHADCDPKHTVHLDAFLNDDWMLEKLFEEGKLQRSYCKDCGSHNSAPIAFISHSLSKRRLQYLFLSLLPDLRGKTIVDLGSRLGAVLYGAYLYSAASKIIGVEMNAELCQIQQGIVDKHALSDKIQIICADIRQKADILKQADVLVIHSVIDFFLPEEEHGKFWTFLRENVAQKGKLIVTTPSLEKSIGHLKLGIDLTTWVKPLNINQMAEVEAINDPDLAELYLYQCI